MTDRFVWELDDVDESEALEKFIWKSDDVEKFNPYHKPGGSPEGGQFASGDGGDPGVSGSKSLSDLVSYLKGGTYTDVGPVEVEVWRAGEPRESGRGIFYADSREDAAEYSSIHGGAAPKKYTVSAKNPIVTTSHMTLHQHLFAGKTFQDAVWAEDKKSGFKSSIEASRRVEAKMAARAKKLGHDAIIYTSPPAPAKYEIAILGGRKR